MKHWGRGLSGCPALPFLPVFGRVDIGDRTAALQRQTAQAVGVPQQNLPRTLIAGQVKKLWPRPWRKADGMTGGSVFIRGPKYVIGLKFPFRNKAFDVLRGNLGHVCQQNDDRGGNGERGNPGGQTFPHSTVCSGNGQDVNRKSGKGRLTQGAIRGKHHCNRQPRGKRRSGDMRQKWGTCDRQQQLVQPAHPGRLSRRKNQQMWHHAH